MATGIPSNYSTESAYTHTHKMHIHTHTHPSESSSLKSREPVSWLIILVDNKMLKVPNFTKVFPE